jgi:hypothetical protein
MSRSGAPVLAVILVTVLALPAEVRGLGGDERWRRFDLAAGPAISHLAETAPEAGSGRSRALRIPADKTRHAVGSLAGTLLGAWGLREAGMAEDDCGPWAGAAMLSVGLFKELALDRPDPRGDGSWGDAAADLAGVLAGVVLWELANGS